jgi:hypothetical protein
VSVGLLKKPIKQLNANKGNIVAYDFQGDAEAEAGILAMNVA